MKAETKEDVGRAYDRQDDEQEDGVVFTMMPSLLGVMNVANLEFPGTKFDFLVVKTSKDGKVSLVRKHEKVRMP